MSEKVKIWIWRRESRLSCHLVSIHDLHFRYRKCQAEPGNNKESHELCWGQDGENRPASFLLQDRGKPGDSSKKFRDMKYNTSSQEKCWFSESQ